MGLSLALAAPGRAAEYLSNAALTTKLRALADGRDTFLRVRSLVQTRESNDVWLVELGQGSDEERRRRPALLLVAGIEGHDLAGTASAVAWVEHLALSHATNTATRQLLESTTLYVLPRMNPDAAARFFAQPRLESPVNNLPTDDDRDGRVDEDPPDDLNHDGLITAMRIKDPEGDWMPDPREPRLMLKADRAKGESGGWRLWPEGRDQDGDEAWNEDGPGGVNFNRNFPFDYRFFSPDAGRHQVSEPETRALADFVIAHPHIGVVFTFGAADNLTSTPKAEAPKRPPVALHEGDAGYYRELGRAWRETLGLKKELPGHNEPGTFSDWMYFHRGRLSLAARPWSLALAVERSRAAAQGGKESAKPGSAESLPEAEEGLARTNAAPKKLERAEARNEEERAWLQWAEAHAPELFVPWRAIEHPDFPGQTVEVGGWAPFAQTNPPEKLLGELTALHARYLTELAGKLPRLVIRQVKLQTLGEVVYDLTVQLENTGYLPTALAQGEFSREVPPTRVVLEPDTAVILAGTRRVMLGAIPGSGGVKEVRWVFRAKGLETVTVEVTSALAGTVRRVIALEEHKP